MSKHVQGAGGRVVGMCSNGPGASRLAQTRAFSLLEQLPDYAAGSKALAEKR